MITYADDSNWLINASIHPTEVVLERLNACVRREPFEPNAARDAFRAALWGPQAYPALNLRDRTISTVLIRLRALAAQGLNAVNVIGSQPHTLRLPTDELVKRLRIFTELGFATTALVSREPKVLTLTPAQVRACLDTLTDLGYNAVEVATTAPAILGETPAALRAKVALLTDAGVDAHLVGSSHPAALVPSVPELSLKLALLRHVDGLGMARSAWNDGDEHLVLSAPIESQILMAGITPHGFSANPTRAESFARDFGFMSREELRRNLLTRIVPLSARYSKEFVENLGPIAEPFRDYARAVDTPTLNAAPLFR